MTANPYDPVTTTDSTYLADDDWGLTLPPVGYKKHRGPARYKSLCYTVRERPRCVVGALVALCVIILMSIIIAVAAKGKSPSPQPYGNEPKREKVSLGLQFYPAPPDSSIVISFNPKAFVQMETNPLTTSIESEVAKYLSLVQASPDYVRCNATYAPFNKTCSITQDIFGDCTKFERKYGYGNSQPCVMLQLVLPDNMIISPITKESELWNVSEKALEGMTTDSSYIPVTCRGTTPADADFINSVDGFGKDSKRLVYFPEVGFPSYIYRQRNTTLPFVRPAMMVRFTHLKDNHLVHITCTAWGQLFDLNNKMVDHGLLEVQFALYIDHV